MTSILDFYQDELKSYPTRRKQINFLKRCKSDLEYNLSHMKAFNWFMGELVRPSQIVKLRVELKVVNNLLNQI